MTCMAEQQQRLGPKIDFVTAKEEWGIYRLTNGFTVRLRFVPIWFKPNLDEHGQQRFTAGGDPEITAHGQLVIRVDRSDDD